MGFCFMLEHDCSLWQPLGTVCGRRRFVGVGVPLQLVVQLVARCGAASRGMHGEQCAEMGTKIGG